MFFFFFFVGFFFFFNLQNKMFSRYTEISLSVRPYVCPSMCQSVDKIHVLVILCCKLSYSFASIVWKLCTYIDQNIKVLQDAIAKYQLCLAWLMNYLSLNLDFFACFFESPGEGIKSHTATALVFFCKIWKVSHIYRMQQVEI